MHIHCTWLMLTFIPFASSQLCGDYTSCHDCVLGSCAWCPVNSTCTNDNNIINGCYSQQKGQISVSSSDCDCLQATSCNDSVVSYIGDQHGWCPYYNKCYQCDIDGPLGVECPPDQYKGTWSGKMGDRADCECLTVSSCQQMVDLDLFFDGLGWCPFYNKCYRGNKDSGPFDLECPADYVKGQWSTSNEDCVHLAASNCTECVGTEGSFDYGWCSNTKKCYQAEWDGTMNYRPLNYRPIGLNCSVFTYYCDNLPTFTPAPIQTTTLATTTTGDAQQNSGIFSTTSIVGMCAGGLCIIGVAVALYCYFVRKRTKANTEYTLQAN